MIEMIRRIFELAGPQRGRLLAAALLNIVQNCCTGGICLTVLFAMVRLLEGRFVTETLIHCTLGMAALLVVRYVLEYVSTSMQSSLGYEIMRDVRIRESRRRNCLSAFFRRRRRELFLPCSPTTWPLWKCAAWRPRRISLPA